MNIKDHLTRFKIDDLEEELTISEVKASRIPEILKLFKSSLGEGPYYCICHGNPAFRILEKQEKYSYQAPENLRMIFENRLKRCYRPGTGKTSYFLKTVLMEFFRRIFSSYKTNNRTKNGSRLCIYGRISEILYIKKDSKYIF